MRGGVGGVRGRVGRTLIPSSAVIPVEGQGGGEWMKGLQSKIKRVDGGERMRRSLYSIISLSTSTLITQAFFTFNPSVSYIPLIYIAPGLVYFNIAVDKV